MMYTYNRAKQWKHSITVAEKVCGDYVDVNTFYYDSLETLRAVAHDLAQALKGNDRLTAFIYCYGDLQGACKDGKVKRLYIPQCSIL